MFLEIRVQYFLNLKLAVCFLQFLSMKLATINPRMEFNANAALSTEVINLLLKLRYIVALIEMFCINNVCISMYR